MVVSDTNTLAELYFRGRMIWTSQSDGWIASPDEVIEALTHDGFTEYRKDVARAAADRQPPGGVWQGLNERTGAVASAIWVRPSGACDTLIFIYMDGHALRGESIATHEGWITG